MTRTEITLYAEEGHFYMERGPQDSEKILLEISTCLAPPVLMRLTYAVKGGLPLTLASLSQLYSGRQLQAGLLTYHDVLSL